MPRHFPRAALALAAAAAPALAQVTPEAHLGHAVGADFELPDWKVVSSFYEQLDAASPRVVLESPGMTTGGRKLLACAISSEANLGRLDAIREDARRIADPRGLTDEAADALLARAVPVVMISIAMHSTEVAAPQFAMQLAYDLATSDAEAWRAVRERAVVVILPCTNPDGLDTVSHWYRDTLGRSSEGSSPPRLYQPYAGHDNNRDWFLLSLQETRLVSSLIYDRWHPVVYWDVHQQGALAERMFVPPFRDPLDPNLDASVMGAIDLIGTRAALDMTSRGLAGVASGVSFDMWWHGGNRNVPVRHNIIGLLTEAASANLASPLWVASDRLRAPSGLARYAPSNRFRMPWPGGWWRMRDIVAYELAFADSLLQGVAREPQLYARTVLEAARRACELGPDDGHPSAWVIPAGNRDGNAVVRLCDALLRTGVEVARATAELRADGRVLPAGTLVIRNGQPAWRHVQDLFEIQAYPGDEPPYDVAGWTLPALLGVEAIAARELEGAQLSPLAQAADARSPVAGRASESPSNRVGDPASNRVGDPASNRVGDIDAWRGVFARLARGEPVSVRGGELFVAGASAAPGGGSSGGAGSAASAGATGAEGSGASAKPAPATWSRLPRIAVYQPWTASMDEGWLRWTLEYCGLPYASVDNPRLRGGDLAQLCDVLVLPDVSADSLDHGREPGNVPEEYAGGLEREGRLAIEAFVRGGGRLVTIGRASAWAIELFQLPLEDAARGKAAGDFSCPGSVLRARLERVADDPLAPAEATTGCLFFSGNLAFAPAEGKQGPAVTTLASYAASDLLLSGWVRSPNVIAGKGAWVRADVGHGRVHLFAFSPHYRSWSQATFHWLLRALMDTRAG